MDKDNKLIADFKSNQDSKCLEKLIERHSGIYVDMVNKYLPENYDQLQRQDVLEDKDFSIYNAVINFDESKNTKLYDVQSRAIVTSTPRTTRLAAIRNIRNINPIIKKRSPRLTT